MGGEMARTAKQPGAKPAAVALRAAALVICGLLSSRPATSQAPCARSHRKQLPRPSYSSFFGRQSPVTGKSSDWQIALVKRERYSSCIYGGVFLFSLKSGRSGAASQFRLCTEALQVDEIDLVSGTRALILGRAGANFPTADVVELPSGKVLDEFSCFMPMASPGHRFLAFLKSFPGHPGPVAVGAEYIVYDLTRSAVYNRPHFKPGTTYDEGWPIFPPGATNATGENLKPGLDSPVHWVSSARLFWLDPRTLAFADFFPGRDRLVVVDLRNGIKKPTIRTLELDPSEIVDLGGCRTLVAPSDLKSLSRDPAALVRVTSVNTLAGSPGVLCLHFSAVNLPAACLKRSDLMVRVP
jgi:hypothetical protein